MNKDVIYIEPEDDITDIISKVRASKQKVVALVPPKKIGVLRSAVNTKLISKAAKSASKVVVIVTTDSALIKLAATAGIPIAKNLQSRPKLPSEIIEESKDENVIEEKSEEEKPKKEAPAKKGTHEINGEEIEGEKSETKKPAEKTDKKSEKGKMSKEDKKNLPPLVRYRKWIIIGVIAVILLIAFLVWAIAFAPAAKIAVQVRTTASNFSEPVTFTTDQKASNTSEGKFLLETQNYTQETAVNFEATGKRDVGEKASGVISAQIAIPVKDVDGAASAAVPKGATFTNNGLTYVVTEGATVTLAETEDYDTCENYPEGETARAGSRIIETDGCYKTAKFKAEATESGDKYNIDPQSTGWTANGVGFATGRIYNSNAFVGGTSKYITTVTEADIVSAQAALAAKVTGDGKQKLLESVKSDVMTLESTYKEENGEAVSVPAAGEEVKDGVKPKLTMKSTYTILTLDMTNLKQYIEEKEKAKLPDDQKIYETTDPFLERFSEDGNGGYTARLKSTTKVGPKVTEEEILEKARGRKVGEVQTQLKSINGVSSCKVETSFFWVNTVPDDPNKVEVNLEVEK